MSDEILFNIGLKSSDFEAPVGSRKELIETILGSARLFRKVLQHFVFKELKTYFKNPELDFSEKTDKYFPYWGRKKDWLRFKNSIELNVPSLRTESAAKVSMIIYTVFYGWVIHLLLKFADFFVHMSLSGFGLGGLLIIGFLFPIAGIFALGQTHLPAKNIEELVDKIIQENMFDYLTDDKAKFKERLEAELSES
ncbi:MAG: hypothetical protein HOP30_04750 [Cyclobacteriaceae bacterium]|nr:hypothetical protein [Cyclobacteriaceae bacterium]